MDSRRQFPRVSPFPRPEGKLCPDLSPYKLQEDTHFSTLGAIYPIRVAPVLRPEGKLCHSYSLHKLKEVTRLTYLSSARHRNALSRPIEAKNRTG